MKWSKWLSLEGITRSSCFEGELYYLLKDSLEKPLVYYDACDEDIPQELLNVLSMRYKHWKNGLPLAYCIGSVPFLQLTIQVNPDVLIPRPATEEWVAYLLNMEKTEKAKLLDIGTGSGCISVALAYHRPLWDITACDISEKALDVARLNAQTHKVQLTCVEADLFLLEDTLEGQWDIIVSNPPYLTLTEWVKLEALHSEPQGALVDRDGDGISCYKAIIAYASRHLSSLGSLWLEHGCNQRAEITQLLERHDFKTILFFDDASGHARTICARKTQP